MPVEPEALALDVGGAEMQYLRWPGSGSPLVMLHATGFLPWLWHPIARELAGDFDVYAPYFCDHREAEPEEGGLSWLLLAEDLAAFIRGIEAEMPLMVGHSMGATVTALAEALHGPLASRAVLIEPIFLPSPFYRVEIAVDQHPLASRSIRRRNAWESRDEAMAYFGTKELFSGWDPEMLRIYLERGVVEDGEGSLTLACHPRREAALFMGGMARDPWELLEKVTCPTLLVEGELSENRSVIDLARAAELMPRAQLRVVEEAGHLVPMQKPREALALIRDFFSL
jgi:pimeloyl-ACP methyl ester carboxylesterase